MRFTLLLLLLGDMVGAGRVELKNGFIGRVGDHIFVTIRLDNSHLPKCEYQMADMPANLDLERARVLELACAGQMDAGLRLAAFADEIKYYPNGVKFTCYDAARGVYRGSYRRYIRGEVSQEKADIACSAMVGVRKLLKRQLAVPLMDKLGWRRRKNNRVYISEGDEREWQLI